MISFIWDVLRTRPRNPVQRSTTERRYNAVQYNMVLRASLGKNIYRSSDPRNTSHTLPWRSSYGIVLVCANWQNNWPHFSGTQHCTENECSSAHQLRRHCWQHKLSFWRLVVPPAAIRPSNRRPQCVFTTAYFEINVFAVYSSFHWAADTCDTWVPFLRYTPF